MTMTDTEATPVVFDYAAHLADGQHLADAADDARQALHREEAAAEDAEIAVEELNLLTDSNTKITKTRLDHERAVAKVAAAKSALSAAERKLKGWNDGSVAELLRPLLADLTGNHSAIGIYAAPVEPDWNTLPVPCIVAVQETPTTVGGIVRQGVIDPSADTGQGQYAARITLTYLRDGFLHRDALGDGADVLRKATARQIGIYGSDRPGAELARQLDVDHGHVGELATSKITAHVRAYPEIPVIVNPDASTLGKVLTGYVERGIHTVSRNIGRTLIASTVEASIIGSRTAKDGIVTTTVEAVGAVADGFGQVVADSTRFSEFAGPIFHKWRGFVDSTLGRCTDVTFNPGTEGYRVTMAFVSRKA